jgi:hypothetical protein
MPFPNRLDESHFEQKNKKLKSNYHAITMGFIKQCFRRRAIVKARKSERRNFEGALRAFKE